MKQRPRQKLRRKPRLRQRQRPKQKPKQRQNAKLPPPKRLAMPSAKDSRAREQAQAAAKVTALVKATKAA